MDEVWGLDTAPSAPRLLASLLCEDVAISAAEPADGRVTLQRVFFDLQADRFPATIERLVMVNVWSGGAGTHAVSMRIGAPDGTQIGAAETVLEVHRELPVHLQIHRFLGLALPAAGLYRVEVLLQGIVLHRYALLVSSAAPAGDEKGGRDG